VEVLDTGGANPRFFFSVVFTWVSRDGYCEGERGRGGERERERGREREREGEREREQSSN
jgi:hypothetical protein